MSKEDKFFESLREFAGYAAQAGAAMNDTAEGRKDPSEGYREAAAMKRNCRDTFGRLTEKMYKAYKNPSELDAVRGIISKIYHSADILKDVLSHMDIVEVGEPPEELPLMARLVSASLEEMKKTLDYTMDVEDNYMKMEARCRRIYTYEERGDECYRQIMKKLYGGEEDVKYLIYWKEIFDQLEEVLDSIAGMVPLLQKIVTHY